MTLLRMSLEQPGLNEPASGQSPVDDFVRDNFMCEASSDFSGVELWGIYCEAVNIKEVPPLKKVTFLKQLPGAMERVFGIRRSHNIRREGSRVRGFKGLGPRPLDRPITAAELELPIEPELVYEPDLDPEPITEPWPVTIVCSPVPRV